MLVHGGGRIDTLANTFDAIVGTFPEGTAIEYDYVLSGQMSASLESKQIEVAETECESSNRILEVLEEWNDYLKHQEFRDDRYTAALDLSEGSNQQLVYLMRAVTPGRYQVPPTQVEDMYRPELRAVGEDIHEVIISE